MKYQPDMNDPLADIRRQIVTASSSWKSDLAQTVNRFVNVQNDFEVKVGLLAMPAFNLKIDVEAVLAPLGKQIEALQQSFKPIIESLVRSLEELPKKNRETLIALADNGWYLDPDLSLPDMFELAEKFTSGSLDDANSALCNHFDGRASEIGLCLISQLPERSRLFASAFEAHRRGEYALSIPVFLAQADGVCHKITGVQLYSKNRNGIPKLADVLLTPDISKLTASMLTPIIEPSPITASSKSREGMTNILNRHAVLHGESTDYDNRLNSCRAISLLVYVAWILSAKDS